MSCTKVSFHTKGLIPVYVSDRPDHNKYAEVSGVKEFYLWGLIGPDHEVFLDDLLYDQGLVSAAGVTIFQEQSLANYLKSLVSFGFYIPLEYRVSAKGVGTSEAGL